MRTGQLARAGLFGVSLVLLASCDETVGIGEKSFQRQYAIARDALEEGRYERASKAYAQLIPKAGPLAPRMKLEYAHAQLRVGQYGKASQIARSLSQSKDVSLKSASLAVYGTAEHELGEAALQRGDLTAGRQHLAAAQSALGMMLKAHPEMDPLGAMAGRKAAVDARLKRL
ncbi:hypothetical protein DZK27_13940 [Rhodobacteraceae bacterium 63075]|nr:hypothetical protein DZK27_13940 [Rhodobacteraceae bacterium 63075]